jgi:hypothetical protein
MDFSKDFLGYNFTWFIGEVEDRNDPLRLGRVKVRCFGWHSSDKELQPTTALPWANTIQPVTGPATSASGLTKGVWVFGFFLDGNKAQRPMILGHIPGYRFGSPGESELPSVARQEADYPSPNQTLRSGTVTEDVVTDPENDTKWSEPAEPADASYPSTLVQAHESGTYTQITGSGRYTIQTNNGSYIELDAGGNGKWKVITDNYQIVGGDEYINVGGTVNMTVAGDVNWNIAGNWLMNVGGNVTWKVAGNVDEEVTGNHTEAITGNHDSTVSGSVNETVSGSATETVSGSKTSTSSGSYTIDGSAISIG